RRAGLETRWRDAAGNARVVGIDTLKAVLAALDLPAGTHSEIVDSRSRLRRERQDSPQLIVARAGENVSLKGSARVELELPGGECKALRPSGEKCGRIFFKAPRD